MPPLDFNRCQDPHDRIDDLVETVTQLEASSGNAFTTIDVSGQVSVTADTSTETLTLLAGTNIVITTNNGAKTIEIASTGAGGNAFTVFAVAGQTNIEPDTATDTFTFVAGSGVTITTDAGTDTLTIASTVNSWSTIAVSGQTSVTTSSPNQTVTFVAGSGITLTTSAGQVTFAATGGGGGDGAQMVWGVLDADLTEDDASVTLSVNAYSGTTNPGATVTAYNVDNLLHPDYSSPTTLKYLFIGNANCFACAAYMTSESKWRLVGVQPPTTRPT